MSGKRDERGKGDDGRDRKGRGRGGERRGAVKERMRKERKGNGGREGERRRSSTGIRYSPVDDVKIFGILSDLIKNAAQSHTRLWHLELLQGKKEEEKKKRKEEEEEEEEEE